MLKRSVLVVVAAMICIGLSAVPASADGGMCKPGGGTQTDCHIMLNGISTHCSRYTEYNGINCQAT